MLTEMCLSASILARLEFQHRTIEELINGHNKEQLRRRNFPGKWSAVENIVHLLTYQLAFEQRIEKILQGNTPLLERYVAENDPLFAAHLKTSLPQLLQDIHNQRTLIHRRLQALDTDQLAYCGLHPVYGNLTLVQWSEFFLLHEAHHLLTIFKLLRSKPEGSTD
jgi:hypothetical protein